MSRTDRTEIYIYIYIYIYMYIYIYRERETSLNERKSTFVPPDL